MHWHSQWIDGGTTIERFYNFIDPILDYMAQNHPGRLFVFTMDNLNAHMNHLILNVLLNSGHRYIIHAPYWPVNDAIEYVFDSFQSELRICLNHPETMDNLRNCINLTVGGIYSFCWYFENVGFPVPP
jgi:hypothetical protein